MPRMKPIEPYYSELKDARRQLREELSTEERTALNHICNALYMLAHNRNPQPDVEEKWRDAKAELQRVRKQS